MESSKFFFFRGSGRDTNTIFVSLETLDLLMCFFCWGGGFSAPLESTWRIIIPGGFASSWTSRNPHLEVRSDT